MARDQRVVFFDVGNVLIDDDPFLSEIFRHIHQTLPTNSPKAQLERFFADVERALHDHGHNAVERLGYRYYRRLWPKKRKEIRRAIKKAWWRLVRMIPVARDVLEALRQDYRLGIIANQPPEVVECLDRWGLLSLFDVVLLDSQYGVAKPDPALFRLAIEEARVDAEQSLMVGDRLDNDVIPARRLGMRAILLWLTAGEKGWMPQSEWGRRFVKILERLPEPRWDSILPKEQPMALVRRWAALPAELERIWTAKV